MHDDDECYLVSYGSCFCGGVDHICGRMFECDKRFCIVQVSHFGFMRYKRNLLFYSCNIFNVAYNFYISSSAIHLYAKVDIEVYWWLSVVRMCGKTYEADRYYRVFKFNTQIQKLSSSRSL